VNTNTSTTGAASTVVPDFAPVRISPRLRCGDCSSALGIATDMIGFKETVLCGRAGIHLEWNDSSGAVPYTARPRKSSGIAHVR
jgi:hypothetical protein